MECYLKAFNFSELILAPVDTQIKIVLVMVFVLMAYVLVMPCIKEKLVISPCVQIIAHIPKVYAIEKNTIVNVIHISKVKKK